jgi:membrane protease YdiL (CAAX protease family)
VLLGIGGFFAVLLLTALATGALAGALHLPDRAFTAIAAIAVAGAIATFVYCLRRWVDRRPWRELGLRLEARAVPQFLGGLILAGATVGAAIAVSMALGWAKPHPYRLDAVAAGMLAFQLGAILLTEALPEELVFRGYVFRNLADALPLWRAWLLTGLTFGSLHVLSHGGANSVQQQLLYAAMAAGLGLLATSVRIVTGTLWVGIGLHAGNDWLLGDAIPWQPASGDLYSNVLVALVVVFTLTSLLVLAWHRMRGSRGSVLRPSRPSPAAASRRS